MKPQDVDTADHTDIKKAKVVCRECYLLCMLLPVADNGRYYQLKADLSNNMTKEANNFPKTMVETRSVQDGYHSTSYSSTILWCRVVDRADKWYSL